MVLVIDDSDDDFLIARRTLRLMDTFDVTVHHAHDVAEAKAITERLRFDVLLVDFCLGIETGASAIQDLGGRVASAVQILLTGMPGQDVPDIALRAGAVQCLNKNQLTPVLLETTIRSALHTHWLEQTLQNAITDLELANRAMSEFFARIGHTLMAPLAAITDRAALMAGESVEPLGPAGCSACAEKIIADSRYLTDALEGFIQDALREGAIRYGVRTVADLGQIVRTALQSVARERQRRGHELEVTLPEGPIEVVGQTSLLSLALLNILHDVVERLRTPGTIRVAIVANTPYWLLTIIAEGTPVHMAPDFEAASVRFGGTAAASDDTRRGLERSLRTVRDIIVSHRGVLECETMSDGIRTVSLILPIAATVVKDVPELMPAAAW
jgi:signal transduction histidine kinase